ncbi:MAG: hypothetical protein JAY67_15915 [Candidatus Thiodiazotropha taylori]|nr:hypothetical protein [Candidatus Thiodiazotropha taylori]
MKSSDFSNETPEDEKERHPGGNPLLVILALVIFTTTCIAFTASVAKADGKVTMQQTNDKAAPKAWRPPIAKPTPPKPPVNEEKAREIANKWGVELLSLRLTAAGYMIDFRFRVLDVEKAKVFFDHRIKPHLVVERSNAKLPIPMAAKVGAFRTTNRGKNIKANKNYYMVFGNPDAHVKSGEKVTMVIGDFKAEHLIVN